MPSRSQTTPVSADDLRLVGQIIGRAYVRQHGTGLAAFLEAIFNEEAARAGGNPPLASSPHLSPLAAVIGGITEAASAGAAA